MTKLPKNSKNPLAVFAKQKRKNKNKIQKQSRKNNRKY